MKITMICEFYNEDLEYQENLFAKYYYKHGHEVTIVTSQIDSIFDYLNNKDHSAGCARVYISPHAKIIRLPFRIDLLKKIRIFSSLVPILAEEKPDLIYFHDIIPNIIEGASYVKAHPKCRMIMDYHGDYSNSGASWLSRRVLHSIIRKWLLDRARPFLSKIFPVVPASLDFLEDLYGVPRSEMELLPLGTDSDFGALVAAGRDGLAVRQSLGIPADHFVIFTGGKLTPLKKTEHLIKAVQALGNPRVHLIVIGDSEHEADPYKMKLRATAQGSDKIHFVGWLDRRGIYQHMDAANVAIFPASQSVLWQQAIGMGLPLIVSERSDLTRGYQDVSYMNLYGNILVLNHERSLFDQITEHLRALIEDPERLARMSAGALRVADELLNYDLLVKQTLRFIADRPSEGGASG